MREVELNREVHESDNDESDFKDFVPHGRRHDRAPELKEIGIKVLRWMLKKLRLVLNLMISSI